MSLTPRTCFSSSLDTYFPNIHNHWNFLKLSWFLIDIWLLEIFLNVLVKNWNLVCTWISVQKNFDATLVSAL